MPIIVTRYQMLNNANLYYILFAIREVYIYLK